MAKPFDRQTLEAAFHEIGRRARADGRIVDIAVYGGSALVLTLNHRQATRDVDAVFDGDRAWLRAVTRTIAQDNGWEETWLNDGVKGFLSSADAASRRLFRTYPSEAEPGLRLYVASPEYLFAMKCMAMRIGGVEVTEDKADILALATAIGINNVEQAIEIVAKFYPQDRIPPKTRFGLEEIFGQAS
jgi:hypothetical protein